ncbi:MAG: tetratricopeptide repeat protein, partial [Planctomycetota bacterium]
DDAPGSERWRARLASAVDHLRTAAEIAPKREDYWLDLAGVCDDAGRTEEALEAARSAVAANEQSVDAHVLVAELALKMGRSADATEALACALSLECNHPKANFIRGNIAFEAGDYRKAAEHLERLRLAETQAGRTDLSGSVEFACRLGRSLFEEGQYVAAARALAPVAEQSRDATFYAGRCHARMGRFENAAKIFRILMRKFGQEPEATFYLAAAYGRLASYEEALRTADLLAEDGGWGTRALCLGAKALARMGRTGDAARRLRRAAERAPDDPEVLLETGRLACVEGDFETAVERFRGALSRHPDDAQCLLWLGRAHYGLGSYEDASQHFWAVLTAPQKEGDVQEHRPLAADAHCHLGWIARTWGKGEQALGHFQQARENGAVSDRLAFDLATCYAESGDYERALAELSSLAVEHPEERAVALNLAAISCRMGQAHFGKERYGRAASLLEQAAERFSAIGAEEEGREATDALAESYFRSGVRALLSQGGEGQQAVKPLEKARSLRPKDERFPHYLGAAYFAQEDYGSAAAVFEEVLESGRQNGKAAGGLALSLEMAGRTEEAERLWNQIIAREADSPLGGVEGRLGLAGLYARRESWRRTGELLHEVLDDEAGQQHQAYEEMCRLAASYLSLAGRHELAAEIIRDHLSGASPGTADAYLGALSAQQDNLQAARGYLEKAARAEGASEAVRDLYEVVCRTLAARSVLGGNMAEAAGLLKAAVQVKREPSFETRSLLSAVQAAMALGGVGGLSEETVAAYEKAHKAQPDNPKMLRNLAILCHRMAIQLEQDGKLPKADQYWRRAGELWRQILSSQDGFWQVYMEDYNQGKRRRARIKDGDLDALRKKVRDKIAGVHMGFVRAYAAAGQMRAVRSHVERAQGLYDRDGAVPELAAALLEEMRKLPADRQEDRVALLELAREVDPDLAGDVQAKKMMAATCLNAAIDHLNNGRERRADASYREAQQLFPDLESDPELRPGAA